MSAFEALAEELVARGLATKNRPQTPDSWIRLVLLQGELFVPKNPETISQLLEVAANFKRRDGKGFDQTFLNLVTIRSTLHRPAIDWRSPIQMGPVFDRERVTLRQWLTESQEAASS